MISATKQDRHDSTARTGIVDPTSPFGLTPMESATEAIRLHGLGWSTEEITQTLGLVAVGLRRVA